MSRNCQMRPKICVNMMRIFLRKPFVFNNLRGIFQKLYVLMTICHAPDNCPYLVTLSVRVCPDLPGKCFPVPGRPMPSDFLTKMHFLIGRMRILKFLWDDETISKWNSFVFNNLQILWVWHRSCNMLPCKAIAGKTEAVIGRDNRKRTGRGHKITVIRT